MINRKVLGHLLFVLTLTVSGTIASRAVAQEITATRTAAAVYLRLVAPLGYDSIVREDSDVLSVGSTMSYRITLYGGVSYLFFAAGDDNINDLDIYLFDENDHLIDHDTSTDNIPIVRVTPRWTGPFIIQVKNYSGRTGWYHFAVAR